MECRRAEPFGWRAVLGNEDDEELRGSERDDDRGLYPDREGIAFGPK